jgi:hypothetical protein
MTVVQTKMLFVRGLAATGHLTTTQRIFVPMTSSIPYAKAKLTTLMSEVALEMNYILDAILNPREEFVSITVRSGVGRRARAKII